MWASFDQFGNNVWNRKKNIAIINIPSSSHLLEILNTGYSIVFIVFSDPALLCLFLYFLFFVDDSSI